MALITGSDQTTRAVHSCNSCILASRLFCFHTGFTASRADFHHSYLCAYLYVNYFLVRRNVALLRSTVREVPEFCNYVFYYLFIYYFVNITLSEINIFEI